MTIFSSLYGTRLDRELGTDDASVLFTTARRKQAINEGAGEFAQLTDCLTRWVNVPIVSGTGEYDLNSTTVIPAGDWSDFAKEPLEFLYTDASSNVTVLSGDAFVRRDILWLDRYRPGWRLSSVTNTSTGATYPSAYYLRADGPSLWLGMTPTPTVGSSATAIVKLPYDANAPVMTAGTDEPFMFNSSARIDLRPYHQGLVHYGAHVLEKLRRDDAASDRQLQKFLGYVSRYVNDMRIKGGRMISLGRSYFGRKVGVGSGGRKDPYR